MPILQSTPEAYYSDIPSVLAVAEGLRAPRHCDMDISDIGDQKTFPPGLFVYESTAFPAPNTDIFKVKMLPRAIVAAEVAIAGTTVTFTRPIAGVFKVGQTISACTDFTAVTGALVGARALGTVASINKNPLNNRYDSITFTTAISATALAAGNFVCLTTPIPSNKIVGLINPNTAFNLSDAPNTQFGVFTEATIHTNRMPQWDAQLAAAFAGRLEPVNVLP